MNEPANILIVKDDRSQRVVLTMLGFFSSCKRLCSDGRTIVIVAQSHAFDERMLVRLRDRCDAHLSLPLEKIGTIRGTTLEVRKTQGVDLNTSNSISFDVQPEVGNHVLPVGKVKVWQDHRHLEQRLERGAINPDSGLSVERITPG